MLILREDLLVALGVANSLTVGEAIAVGVVGVAQRHALHSVAVISMRLNEVHALVLGGFFLAHHL